MEVFVIGLVALLVLVVIFAFTPSSRPTRTDRRLDNLGYMAEAYRIAVDLHGDDPSTSQINEVYEELTE